jgi:hypothetical protein
MRASAILTSLILTSVLAAPRLAAADDTFEARAASAVRVAHLDDIVWALTAPCDKGDDTQQRQCRRLRDARASQLANATMLVDADRDAFTVGAWNAQKKSAELTLSACIKCGGIEVDGQTWYIVGNKEGVAAPRVEGGKLKTGQLIESARTFPNAASAKQLTDSLPKTKLQMLVKLAPKAKWTESGKQGISLDVLDYRVYSACDGSIVFSSVKSGPGEVDKRACTSKAETLESPDEPVDHSVAMKNAMKPVIDAAKKCYAKEQKAGKAKLHIVVAPDGSLAQYEQKGDFAGSPTGSCIDVAMKHAAFPKADANRSFSATISLP